ncbi:zinc-binding dehydrogenase [Actinophytocola sp.]|uniref:zinc-binding dehydrogenase n=1 Tax=Actinophytocola sp. TaxID=1872138 RepID=UPI003D6C2AA1
MSKMALVAVVGGAGEPLTVREIVVPELHDGALLVRVEAATVCGTDVAMWRGDGHHGLPPYIPGHETAGIVVDIRGSRTDVLGEPVRPGDRIIWSYPFCGECFYCSVAGQESLCTNTVRFGRAAVDEDPGLLGGFATHHYVPPRSGIVKVPEGVSPALAASASCALRTVMHGFERLGRVAAHEVCLVQGSGPVGLYATAVARTQGFRSVYVIGAPDGRLDLARTFGADDTLSVERTTAAERVAWVNDRSGGRGADVVIQSAIGSAIPEGLAMARPGGRFVSIGAGGASTLEVPALTLHGKMLTIVGVRAAQARHYYAALQFLAGGSAPFELLTAGTDYALNQATEALVAMETFAEVKPVVDPTLPI